jgi:hypothetical protein
VNRNERTALAFLAAAVAPVVALLVFAIAISSLNAGSVASTSDLLLIGLPALCISAPWALVTGVPLYALAARFDRVNGYTAVLGGALGGVLPVLPIGTWSGAAFGGLGAIGGLAFWLVWRPKGRALTPAATAAATGTAAPPSGR